MYVWTLDSEVYNQKKIFKLTYAHNKKGGLNDRPGLDCTSWYVQGKNPRGRQSESESEL